MAKNDETSTWPDLAGQLYDKLTGKGSTIHYNFDNFSIEVPSKVGADAVHTKWVLSGTLNISTKNA